MVKRLARKAALCENPSSTMICNDNSLYSYKHNSHRYKQWNPSNPDTNGTEVIILISEVSLLSAVKLESRNYSW